MTTNTRWMGDRGARLANEGWRYITDKGVRHLTHPNLFETTTLIALCGKSGNRDFHWHGTGSQTEYETLAELPKCLTCSKVENGYKKASVGTL